MNKKHLTLVSRIHNEIPDIKLTIERIQVGWERAR